MSSSKYSVTEVVLRNHTLVYHVAYCKRIHKLRFPEDTMTVSDSQRYIYPLIIFVLLFSACTQEYSFEAVSIDSSSVQIKTSDPTNSTATCTVSDEPILVIGDKEEDEHHIFSSIRGAGRLSDGSIAVVDRTSAEIRIFDGAGQHLRSMGGRGRAPDEFENPFLLWITEGDTIWVGDYRPWRYNLFTAEGEFVRGVGLEPGYQNPSRGGGVLDNGYTVNAIRRQGSSPDFEVADTLIVEVHDPTGKLDGSLARMYDQPFGILREESNFWLQPLFSSRALVDARGSIIALAHGSKPEVRILDSAFNLKTVIRWLDPPREVTSQDIRAWREDYRNARSSSSWSEMDDDIVSQDRPAADFFPALSWVIIGRNGRIWIRQYDRPREDRRWLAFDSDGEFVCHMAPLPASVEEFGEDYVILLGESEFGAETVQVHSLSRSL